MKRVSVVAGMLLILSGAVYAEDVPRTAKATLRNAVGEELGKAVFIEESEGVKIVMNVHGFPQGPHGFHIHSIGKCDPPDFTSAGSHFNPYGKKHGLKNPDGAHAGDLQNLSIGIDGSATEEWIAKGVTLGPGENSLLKPEGTSLVIHVNPDDEKTDPAGNAGARIACGVITQ